MTYTITDVHPVLPDMLTSAGWAATVTLADGHTMGVSHVETDPDGVWGVDSLFGPNSFPHWCHGEGSRVTSVKTVNDDVAAALDAAVSATDS